MKKLVYSFVICLVLSMFNAVTIYGANDNKVVDDADLLSDYEEQELESMAMDIVERYNFDVVIVTTNTLEGKSPMAYADDYFDYNGYGIGENFDGILFLVSMEDRDYWFSTCGYGITAFTDYGIEQIGDKCAEYLSDGNYYYAFDEYIEQVERYLDKAATGKPYDVNNKDVSILNIIFKILMITGFSFIAGFITVTIMKSGMNTVKGNNAAREYIRQGSFNLTKQADVFLYSNVSKVRKDTSSGSGGSSRHRSSSGRSHGGGGGKF